MSNTNGPLRRLESWLLGVQRIADAIVIVAAQFVAHAIFAEPWRERTTTTTVIALMVFGLAAVVQGLYRPWRTGATLRASKDAVMAWLAAPPVLFALWYFTETATQYSRATSFAW